MTSLPLKIAAAHRRMTGRPLRQFSHPMQLLEAADAARVSGAATQPPAGLLRTARITTESMSGGSVITITSKTGTPSPTLIYIHGGAFLFPFAHEHWRILDRVHRATGATIIAPLYPLAPEGTHADAIRLLRRVVGSKLSSESASPDTASPATAWTLAGDSAGGGLALSLAHSLRDTPIPNVSSPYSVVLFSPWLDLSMSETGEDAGNFHDPVLARPGLVHAGTLFAATQSVSDPSVSPLFADPRGLPHITIHHGALDILVPYSRALQRRATDAGAVVSLTEYPGALHGFVAVPLAPEATSALGALTAAIRSSCTSRVVLPRAPHSSSEHSG